MRAWVFIILGVMLVTGCNHVSRKGVMSQELPLTMGDIEEIRKGEENHEEVLKHYALYTNPKVEAYVNVIAARLAEVSTRPKLPYRVFILNDEEVHVFGGPGGYIYITRGLLDFVQSESELAGVIAHEIGHISHYDYADLPQYKKIKLFYKGLLKGSELAKNSIGTYGTAAYYGVKGIGQAAPYIAKQFNKDTEIVADGRAVEYLLKAGYDPRGYQQFVERIARIKMADISRFVMLLNTHLPFPERREILRNRVKAISFEEGSIQFRKDSLSEVRQTNIATVQVQPQSILFEPELGVRRLDPLEMDHLQREKEEKFVPMRRRLEWL